MGNRRAVSIGAGVALAAAAAAVGVLLLTGRPTPEQGRVVAVSLTLRAGFDGTLSRHSVTVSDRGRLAHLARLIPLPLPGWGNGEVNGALTCFPGTLTITLSTGAGSIYPPCKRPASLRALVGALCPLLRSADRSFCLRYRHELGGRASA